MDAAAKRDLHDAIWRSSGGFDLVLAPVLIATSSLLLLVQWIYQRLLLRAALPARCPLGYPGIGLVAARGSRSST